MVNITHLLSMVSRQKLAKESLGDQAFQTRRALR